MSELDREKGASPVTDAPLEAFITNLGKYNEGELVGEWLKLPATPEQLMQTFQNIGIDGKQYEEYFITDYNTPVDGLYEPLPEYANLDELNYLAAKLDDMSGYDLDRYQAILSYQGADNVADLINLADSLDSFDILPDVHSEEDLGYYWIEDAGVYDLKSMGNLASYIDYERFGRDVALDEGGTFTDKGYIRDNGDGISNEYDGLNVPDEYRIMRLPEDEPDKVHGYEVQKSIVFENNRGFALAENPNAPQSFVTWQLTENEDGRRDYYWGHYSSDKDSAVKDFHNRVDEYRRDYGLAEKGADVQPDNYLKSVEMSVEQNLDMLDGIINNEPPSAPDLTDGQTFEEIQELAPETVREGKPSIKDQLRDCADALKAADAIPKPPKQNGLELE